MFIRDMDSHPDLRRIRLGEASIEDMRAWVTRAPEEILRSPSMAILSLESPGEWKGLLAAAVDDFAKRCLSFSCSYIGRTSADFIAQSRSMLKAATTEFGPLADRDLETAIMSAFTTKFPDSSFYPLLSEMFNITARLVPSPVSFQAEKLACIQLMKGYKVPPEIAPYVHPWKAESWS